MIKYLKLLQSFDSERMLQEISLLEEKYWKEHYNKSHYSGNWTVLSLRSIGGNPDNVVALHAASNDSLHAFQDTSLLQECPYIREVLNFFECEKTSVRLMKLHSGAEIKEHRDLDMSFEEGEVRFHIPLITNARVGFFLDQEQIILKSGECWYLNLSLKHRVSNSGNSDRVHLVLDCKVNEWVKNIFSTGFDVCRHIEPEEELNKSHNEKMLIIERLKEMNTPTSIQLALEMEKELGK